MEPPTSDEMMVLKRDMEQIKQQRDLQNEGDKEHMIQNFNVPMEFLSKAGLNPSHA